MEISRRTMLKTATVATGAALAGAYGLTARAGAATTAAAVSASATARVGATVTPLAYPAGTTWVQAMEDFNNQVGRDFEVAKRYYQGASTWPTDGDFGMPITSLVQRGCRGLLCFQPRVNGDDLEALVNSLNAIKLDAKLTDAKVTLWDEQGLGSGLTAAEFKRAYANYQPIREIFPLFVCFEGASPTTWAAYNPGADLVDGFAVDFYADGFVNGIKIDPVAEMANDAGTEFGIWEIGNCATPSAKLPTAAQVGEYFSYITSLQAARLNNGYLVGDMAWYNGPHLNNWNNTISGIASKLSADYLTDRQLLDQLYDTFNGVS
jgi:hypothetical protein